MNRIEPSALVAIVSAAMALAPPVIATAPADAQEPAMTTTEIRDRAAITETIENIARGADLRQWASVRASFAPLVTLDYGQPEALSPAAVVERWEPLLEAFDGTQHSLSDLAIRIDGDRASASSTFLATHWMAGVNHGEVWTLAGRYEHDLVRAADGWRVTRMRMVPGESSGNAALLAEAQRRAAAAAPEGRAVVEAFFQRLEAFDIAGVAALFDANGRQVMPYSPEGFPDELVGPEAVFNQSKGMPENYRAMRFTDRTIRALESPGEFFVTYRGEIELRNGGRYDNTYAALFRIEAGRIVEFVEYFDPIILKRAFGESLQSNFNVTPRGGRCRGYP